jgi:hypothetical protein
MNFSPQNVEKRLRRDIGKRAAQKRRKAQEAEAATK